MPSPLFGEVSALTKLLLPPFKMQSCARRVKPGVFLLLSNEKTQEKETGENSYYLPFLKNETGVSGPVFDSIPGRITSKLTHELY